MESKIFRVIVVYLGVNFFMLTMCLIFGRIDYIGELISKSVIVLCAGVIASQVKLFKDAQKSSIYIVSLGILVIASFFLSGYKGYAAMNRVGSLGFGTNETANFACVILAIALFVTNINIWVRVGAAIVSVACVLNVASRRGMLVALAIPVIWIFANLWKRRSRKIASRSFFAGVVILLLGVAFVVLRHEQISSYINNSALMVRYRFTIKYNNEFLDYSGRLSIYDEAFEYIKNHLFLGSYGCDKVLAQGHIAHAHNLLLQFIATYGIVFGLVFATYVVITFFRALKIMNVYLNRRERTFPAIISLFFILYFTFEMFGYLLWNPKGVFWIALDHLAVGNPNARVIHQGNKGSQAGTSLRTIMNNLAGEVKFCGKNIGEVTIQTTNADGSMRELSDILADCRVAFSQLSESEAAAAAETLVGKNAMSGFLALMNAAPGDIEKLSSAIDVCSDVFVKTADGAIIPMSQALEEGIEWVEEYNGVAEQMAATMQDNLAGQLTILKSQLEELAISFGEMLMPAIRAIVSRIQAFVDKLNNMSDSQREAILRVGLFVAALGPLLVIFGTVISKVGGAMQGFVKLATGVRKLGVAVKPGSGLFGKLGAALGGVSGPVLAVVAVIGVLVAAFKHLWDTNEEFRNAITAIWAGIVGKIREFCQGITERLNALGFDFTSIVDVLKSVWDGFCQFLAPVFEAAFNVLSTVLGTVLNVITGLLDVFIGLFTRNWSQLWNGVKEIFSGIWDGITGLFDTALNLLKSLAETVFGWFGTTWESVWSGIKAFFETVWNGIVSFFSGIWSSIVSTVTNQINAVKTVVTTVFTAVNTTVSSIWTGIKTTISTVVDGIKTKVTTVFDSVKNTVTSVFNGIKSTATSVWNGVRNAIITPVETAKEKVRSMLETMKSFFANLHLQLPHIKLPHFRVSGTLSINPPSVPHLSIDWYKEGGIMTKPTVFGMNGSSLMAGGEAGKEAILPLSGFYQQLEAMLTEKLNTSVMEKYLAIIADNSGKGIYLDDGTLIGKLLPVIDNGLGQRQKLNARLAI